MIDHCIQQEKIEELDHRLIIREERGKYREEHIKRIEGKLDIIVENINELKIQRANYNLIQDELKSYKENNKIITEELSNMKQQLSELEGGKNSITYLIPVLISAGALVATLIINFL